MGFFTKKQPNEHNVVVAQEDAPKFERVQWSKEPGLRKLYFYAVILCVASATTGYDGYVLSCPGVVLAPSSQKSLALPRGQDPVLMRHRLLTNGRLCVG